MKKVKHTSRSMRLITGSLLCAALLIAGCEDATIQESENSTAPIDPSQPPTAINQSEVSAANRITENDPELNVAHEVSPAVGEASARLSGATTMVHFGDETACTWNPNICDNTFVTWPGYIQNTGYNEWGYAWMSNGPRTNFISYGTGSHYHIAGFLFPDTEPNPKHTAMFGSDWFAFYMQRSGTGRINFDLTQIKVNGTVPITLWFKAANGSWWYWPSIGPGRWNLPGAANIQEFHVRAASGASGDKYSIDDIRVKGL